jgi:dGTP triphosphohydrolase
MSSVGNVSGGQSEIGRKHVSFEEKNAIVKKMTGRDVDKDTPYIMSKESQVRLSYAGEFLRVGVWSSGGDEALIKDTAQKYAEMKNEIREKYKDDEDEMYKQMGELNQAFEMALSRNALVPVHQDRINTKLYASTTPEELRRNEEEIERIAKENDAYNKTMRGILSNLHNNMKRNIDEFFESFIEKTNTQDFETAYTESMALLKERETKSYEDIAYDDLLKIRDELFATDTDGKPMPLDSVLRSIIDNEDISALVREGLARELGL